MSIKFQYKGNQYEVPLKPEKCNLCGGKVVYIPNSPRVYSSPHGSGFCYFCENCGAYVGTHKPHPEEALGLLSDENMRKGKMMCHALFDPHWRNQKNRHAARNAIYRWLSEQMGIPSYACHFGYFDIHQLRDAYRLLRDSQDVLQEIAKNSQLEGKHHGNK